MGSLQKLTRFILFLLLSSKLCNASETCVPENHLRFPADLKQQGLIDQASFNYLIDQFEAKFKTLFLQKTGKQLLVKREWDSDKVNAHATRDMEDNAIIVIHGGMVRHPDMTEDGLLLTLCHELGHHLGGAPKSFRGNTRMLSWSSAEGQADYYATTKCLPILLNNSDMFEKSSDHDAELAYERCGKRQHKCARMALAGLAVGKLFATLQAGGKDPALNKLDMTQVHQTLYTHANPQCRVDTFVAGAVCDADPQMDFDGNDPSVGACSDAQASHVNGTRPRCWYHPSL